MKKTSLFIVFLSLFLVANSVKAESIFTKDLYFGIQNDSEVIKLQEFLMDEGLYSGPITGNFFSLTLKAVKSFQERESISPVAGYFGPLTRTKANDIISKTVEASNNQAIQEVGTAPEISKSNSIQDQINSLLQQISSLQQQLQQSTTQTTTNTQIPQFSNETQPIATQPTASEIIIPEIKPSCSIIGTINHNLSEDSYSVKIHWKTEGLTEPITGNISHNAGNNGGWIIYDDWQVQGNEGNTPLFRLTDVFKATFYDSKNQAICYTFSYHPDNLSTADSGWETTTSTFPNSFKIFKDFQNYQQ